MAQKKKMTLLSLMLALGTPSLYAAEASPERKDDALQELVSSVPDEQTMSLQEIAEILQGHVEQTARNVDQVRFVFTVQRDEMEHDEAVWLKVISEAIWCLAQFGQIDDSATLMKIICDTLRAIHSTCGEQAGVHGSISVSFDNTRDRDMATRSIRGDDEQLEEAQEHEAEQEAADMAQA